MCALTLRRSSSRSRDGGRTDYGRCPGRWQGDPGRWRAGRIGVQVGGSVSTGTGVSAGLMVQVGGGVILGTGVRVGLGVQIGEGV